MDSLAKPRWSCFARRSIACAYVPRINDIIFRLYKVYSVPHLIYIYIENQKCICVLREHHS